MNRKYRNRTRIMAIILSTILVGGNFVGSVPGTMVHAAEVGIKETGLPEKYSSRDQQYVTPIRSQGTLGNCWAYAGMAAVEINMAKNGIMPTSEIDLSESHAIYYRFRPVGDPLGGTSGDYEIKNKATIDAMFNGGGSIGELTNSLLAWMGPVAENSFHNYYSLLNSYDTVEAGEPLNNVADAYGERVAIVTETVEVPPAKIEEIKRVIMEYGSVGVHYYYNSRYYDGVYASYYCPEYKSMNHAVTIVGWDDNFSKEKFGGEKPKNDGAWLVRNSWGTRGVEGGYFWLSYEDNTMSGVRGFKTVAPDTYDNNYQYDRVEMDFSYISAPEKGEIDSVNVFEIQEEKELLKAVQLGIKWSNTNYKIQIYKNPKKEGDPTSGEALLETPIEGSRRSIGRYTVDLGKPIELVKGDRFAVCVTYTSNNPKVSPAAECEQYGIAKKGESYYRINGGEWVDCSEEGKGNMIIKAFTSNVKKEQGSAHTHDWEKEWSYNDTYHWHDCAGDGTCTPDAGKHYEKHVGGRATCISGAICDTCGQTYGKTDGTNHVGGVATVGNVLPENDVRGVGFTGDLCCVGCDVIFKAGIDYKGEAPDFPGDLTQYTVSFESQGGSPVYSMKVYNGGLFQLPEKPTMEGYQFVGWYTQADGNGQKFDETYNITGDITVYAKWEKDPTSQGGISVEKTLIDSVTVDVTAPVAGVAPQRSITNGSNYSATITWNTTQEIFGYNTAYTATVTLRPDSNYAFVGGLTVDGWIVKVNDDGTATLTRTFDNTSKEKLTALAGIPTNTQLSMYHDNANAAAKKLISNVTYKTETGATIVADIEWSCTNYDSAISAQNIFTWTVKDGALGNYNINGMQTTGSITVNVMVEAGKDTSNTTTGLVPGGMGGTNYGAPSNSLTPTSNTITPDTGRKNEVLETSKPDMPKEADSQIMMLPVTDVHTSDWFYDSVHYVYSNGLMSGMDETTFAPAELLSRAQFAVILHRMNGTPQVEYTNKFTDVKDGAWYTDAVLWANSIGIIIGYKDNGMFGSADNITREQMALMMYRYAAYKGYDTIQKSDLGNFPDSAKVSSFAQEAMQWAVSEQIITGREPGPQLDPQGIASRAECATIIMRFMQKYAP